MTNKIMITDKESFKALVQLGQLAQAEQKLEDFAEKHGEEEAIMLIMSEPASATARFVSKGDGNDPSIVAHYMSDEEYKKASLIAIFDLVEKLIEEERQKRLRDTEGFFSKSEKITLEPLMTDQVSAAAKDILLQVFNAYFVTERKRSRIKTILSDETSRLIVELALYDLTENDYDEENPTWFDSHNDETEYSSVSIAREISGLGFEEEVFAIHQALTDDKKPTEVSLIWSIVGAVRDMTAGKKEAEHEENIFDID